MITFESVKKLAAVKMVGARAYVLKHGMHKSEAPIYLYENRFVLLLEDNTFARANENRLIEFMHMVEYIRFLKPQTASEPFASDGI